MNKSPKDMLQLKDGPESKIGKAHKISVVVTEKPAGDLMRNSNVYRFQLETAQ